MAIGGTCVHATLESSGLLVGDIVATIVPATSNTEGVISTSIARGSAVARAGTGAVNHGCDHVCRAGSAFRNVLEITKRGDIADGHTIGRGCACVDTSIKGACLSDAHVTTSEIRGTIYREAIVDFAIDAVRSADERGW